MDKPANCIVVDDEPVAREILENHLERIDSITVVASCKSAMEAFKIINTHPVDLVFLDINMPDISGLSFARSMSKEYKVIFTTAYRESISSLKKAQSSYPGNQRRFTLKRMITFLYDRTAKW